ncbi:ComEA family DNA-binding protein [Reinekea sp.]|jgi:competence protein ComEA|uniref:ComEA family DNA-binding protein n=1 Tax=Reinekea sp. TaxID=1970455 RepID=UPI0039899463
MKKLALLLVIVLSAIAPSMVFADTSSSAAEEVILFVDINVDSAEKMSDLLKGVGLKKAQAIVEYRQENGPFETVEDLLNVSGIGPATLEKNRSAIKVGFNGE